MLLALYTVIRQYYPDGYIPTLPSGRTVVESQTPLGLLNRSAVWAATPQTIAIPKRVNTRQAGGRKTKP